MIVYSIDELYTGIYLLCADESIQTDLMKFSLMAKLLHRRFAHQII